MQAEEMIVALAGAKERIDRRFALFDMEAETDVTGSAAVVGKAVVDTE